MAEREQATTQQELRPQSNAMALGTLGLRRGAIAVAGILALLYGIAIVMAEGFWFQEVHYLPVFWFQLLTRLGLGAMAFMVSVTWLLGNLRRAERLAWPASGPEGLASGPEGRDRLPLNTARTGTLTLPGAMGLGPLLLLAVTAGLLLIGLLFYHTQATISHWYPSIGILTQQRQIPIMFRPETLWQTIWQTLNQLPWLAGAVPALLVAIAFYPRTILRTMAWLLGLSFSLLLAEYWQSILLAAHPMAYGQTDPIFHRDIGFYIFQLPICELLAFWLVGLGLMGLLSVMLVYLLSGQSLSHGYFPGFSDRQRRHLYALASPAMGAIALSYWTDRYELLYSPTGVTYGASYTNVVAQLPTNTVLSIGAGVISLYFLGRATLYPSTDPPIPRRNAPATGVAPTSMTAGLTLKKRRDIPSSLPLYQQPSLDGEGTAMTAPAGAESRSNVAPMETGTAASGLSLVRRLGQVLRIVPVPSQRQGPSSNGRLQENGGSPFRSCQIADAPPPPRSSPFFTVMLIYLVVALVGSVVVPPLVQRLVVQPNELEREQPYLEYTIGATREAFDLDDIDVQIFDPQANLTYDELLSNGLTVNNIRLWDTRPLLETNRQLQRIRLYYEFPDADVDRYTFADPQVGASAVEEEGSQDGNDLISDDAQSVAVNPADQATQNTRQVLISARELDYKSVPDEAKTWVNEHLIYTHGYGFTMSPVNTATDSGLPDYFIRGIEHTVSDASVRQAVPVLNPRIYYGELTDTYIMSPTQVEELDYPSGSDNVYTNYEGDGGVAIYSFWRRLLYANYLRDWRMVLTNNVTSETKLLMRRTIGDRIKAIAPFLQYDSDPYLVIADATLPSRQANHAVGTSGISTGVPIEDQPPSNLFWVIDAYTTSDRYPYSDPLANDFNYIRNSVKVVVDAYHGTVEYYVADANDPIIQAWSRIFPGMFRSLSDLPEPLGPHIRYPQDYYQIQSQQLMTYHMTDPRVFYNREDQWRSPQEIYGTEQQPLKPYYLLMELPTEDKGEFILLHPYTPAQRRNLIAWLAARSDGITSDSATTNHYGKRLLYVFPKQDLIFGPEQIEARINQDPAISEQISLWNRTGSRAIQGNLLVIPIEESLLYVEPIYLEAEEDQLPTLVRVIAAFGNQIAMEPTLPEALAAVFNGDRPEDPSPPSIDRINDISEALSAVPRSS